MTSDFSATKLDKDEPRLEFVSSSANADSTEAGLLQKVPNVVLESELKPQKIALMVSNIEELNHNGINFYACLGKGALKYSTLLERPLLISEVYNRFDYYGLDVENGVLWWSGDKVSDPSLSDLYIFPFCNFSDDAVNEYIHQIKNIMISNPTPKVGVRLAPQLFSQDAATKILTELLLFFYSQRKVTQFFFVQENKVFMEMLNVASKVRQKLVSEGFELSIHH